MFQKKIKNKVLKALNEKGCNARAIWKPLHTLKMYKKCQKDNLNTSLKIYNSSINLPSSPIINFIK